MGRCNLFVSSAAQRVTLLSWDSPRTDTELWYPHELLLCYAAPSRTPGLGVPW